MYYSYVLESMKGDKLYIGQTSDLQTRLSQYNNGEEVLAKFRKSFKLLYFQGCLNKYKAIGGEKYFKQYLVEDI